MDAGSAGSLTPLNRDVALKAIPKMWSLGKELTFQPLFSDLTHLSTNCASISSTSGMSTCSKIRHKLKIQLEATPSLLNPVAVVSFRPGSTASAFCIWCLKAVKGNYDKVRQQIWSKLPKAFGMPSWEEMCKQEEESYGVGSHTD